METIGKPLVLLGQVGAKPRELPRNDSKPYKP